MDASTQRQVGGRAGLTVLALLSIVGRTASAPPDLFLGVQHDSPKEIARALKAGAKIDRREAGSGQTPLMKAVLMGKLQAVKFLLDRGADPSVPEKDGYTPMHGAGFQGRAEITRVLLAHGLDVNDIHTDGHGPVQRAMWGSRPGHTETARIMLEAGAKLTGNERPSTPATIALLKEWKGKAGAKAEKTEL
mmetsp:Transcript_5142/g.13363  ORF Transcript_5142/g.13363 Transcript_5142/m.13363 type:complete len:191 (+) Transcript_5142:61-633(+)